MTTHSDSRRRVVESLNVGGPRPGALEASLASTPPAMTTAWLGADHDQERPRVYENLARSGEALARLVARHGHPDPFSWGVLDDAVGGDAFAELVFHIVSQQISTRAALTIYGRLRTLLDSKVNAGKIVATPVGVLRSAGLSGAKASSLHDLAERVEDDRLSFDALAGYDDASAQAALVLPERPTAEELSRRAKAWRPFRSYAAALVWAHGRSLAKEQA